MIEKVRLWLNEQGYTLEMKTAAAFRAAGFEVSQSSIFVDQESGKSRETDVLAIEPLTIGIAQIGFVIECKRSKKPWVVLTSRDTLLNLSNLFSLGLLSKNARRILATRWEEFQPLIPWIEKNDRVGYSLRQAHSDQDSGYATAISLVKGTWAWSNGDHNVDADRISFAFPIIVTDAPILECSLNETGEIELAEVQEAEFLFLAKLPQDFATCIRILSVNRVDAFAQEARSISSELRQRVRSEELAILHKGGSNP